MLSTFIGTLFKPIHLTMFEEWVESKFFAFLMCVSARGQRNLVMLFLAKQIGLQGGGGGDGYKLKHMSFVWKTPNNVLLFLCFKCA